MKFLSVAIVSVLLFATVAYGAPSTPNKSYKEIIYEKFLSLTQFKKYFGDMVCIRDVVDEIMTRYDLKGMWVDNKKQMDRIVDVEWKRCLAMRNSLERDACKAACIENGIHVMTNVLTTLFSEYKLDIINQMRREITNRCLGKDDQYNFSGIQLNDESLFVERFECLVDVLGDVSKSTGFDELWSNTEPELQHHVNDWKNCQNLESKFATFVCNMKAAVQSYRVFNTFMNTVDTENPEALQLYASEYRRKCSASNVEEESELFDEFISDNEYDYRGPDNLRCISNAITDAVHETDFARVWEEYRKDLDAAFERIDASKQELNKWESVKRIAKEVYASYDILEKFTENLKQANLETYQRIRRTIKKRCS